MIISSAECGISAYKVDYALIVNLGEATCIILELLGELFFVVERMENLSSSATDLLPNVMTEHVAARALNFILIWVIAAGWWFSRAIVNSVYFGVLNCWW
jgi:hypothetical protein